MNVLITEQINAPDGPTIGATCGKIRGCVSIGKRGVDVICCNAAHAAWRKGGRYFGSIAEALGAYKSPEMKAIIQTAADIHAGKISPPASKSIKPQTVRLKLSGHYHLMPFIVDNTPEFICFGNEPQATNFTRARAAQILRRIRSWGNPQGWYKMEVVK